MASLKDKTPASLLMEYSVSKKMIPSYELIHNGTGSHIPKFVYRLQVGSVQEEGSGRSKQEAKHRAAEKMLKRLKVINDNQDEECTVDSQLVSGENYVGELKELCLVLHYPEPKYCLEEAAGPAHSKIFKMKVIVSQLQEFGISRTKKAAKHQAAYKMLLILKKIQSKGTKDTLCQENLVKEANRIQLLEEEILKKYKSLKTTDSKITKNPTVFYKDHHQAYVALTETSPTLAKIIEKGYITEVADSLSLIKAVAKELEVTLSTTKIPAKKDCANYTVMTISVFPAVAAVGISENDAAFNLIKSFLVLCND